MDDKYNRVLKAATAVLNDPKRAERWMNTPLRPLGYETPKDFLQLPESEESVLRVLQQIEHSVYL